MKLFKSCCKAHGRLLAVHVALQDHLAWIHGAEVV